MPEVEVEGRTLQVSRLEKVLYPHTGFTKAGVIDYYTRIAPVLLTHIRDRPLTFHRFPNGVEASGFYEKQIPSHRPEWFVSVEVPTSGRTLDSPVATEVASLVWMANIAALEVHPLLARHPHLDTPSKLTLDLDPGAPADVIQCCEVALLIRELFEEFDLQVFPKTSGSKGVQLDVPLNNAGVTYEQTSGFAQAIAQLLEQRHPELVVSRQEKAIRKGKVLIDWSQNSRTKTTIAPYSLRARERPTVSTPLTWDEVEAAVDEGDAQTLVFETADVLVRVEELGDLHAPVETVEQALPVLK